MQHTNLAIPSSTLSSVASSTLNFIILTENDGENNHCPQLELQVHQVELLQLLDVLLQHELQRCSLHDHPTSQGLVDDIRRLSHVFFDKSKGITMSMKFRFIRGRSFPRNKFAQQYPSDHTDLIK